MIVTRGGKGSIICSGAQRIDIPVAPIREIKDPTGCGDAYRAGLLYGLMNGMDWETTGRLAALMGAVKIERHGTQNHAPGADELTDRFLDSFGFSIAL